MVHSINVTYKLYAFLKRISHRIKLYYLRENNVIKFMKLTEFSEYIFLHKYIENIF